MAVEIRGTLQPKLQRQMVRYSPASGYLNQYDYRGIDSVWMRRLMQQWINLNCEVTLNVSHGIATLEVVDSTGEITLDEWQILQNDERPTSLVNPLNLAATADDVSDAGLPITGQDVLDAIAIVMAAGECDLGTLKAANYKQLLAYFTTNGMAASARLLQRMNSGADSYYQSAYVLRHTTNASSRYEANVADFNVDRIYTVAQLLSEVTSDFYWRLPLPPQMEYFINNLDFPTPRANYQNGWLKRGASRSTAANFRIQLTTEYWMGQISTDEYQMAD